MTITIFKRTGSGDDLPVRVTNGRYLVAAHQTATSDALLRKMLEIERADPGATFTLVVPATPVERGLTWTEGESIAAAQRTALVARNLFESCGLNVDRAFVGDVSPVQAIADELAWGNRYDAFVISTFPPGISKWLRMDVHQRARQRFHLPVISVLARREVLVAA